MNVKFLNTAFKMIKNLNWDISQKKDTAKILIGLAALGFALSSFAQCFAIKINDKIDDKKKRFLLRQELADGAVNIGLFLAVTNSVWKVSDKILNKLGLLKGNLSENSIKQIKNGGRIATTMIASILTCNIITPLIRNFIAGKITAHKDKKEINKQFHTINIMKKQSDSPFKNIDDWAVKAIDRHQSNYKHVIPKYNCWNNFGSIKI